jgi:hypothetical protein
MTPGRTVSAPTARLEAFVETAHEQELVGRPYRVEELFAPNLPEAFR